jgi:hypothetical protein
MAIKFSGLPASGALDGTEVVAVSQVVSGTLTSVKTTTGAIAALGGGSGGTGIIPHYDFQRDFGGDPTFATDSTAAFQNALNTIASAGGGALFMGYTGHYKIAGALQDTSRGNAQLLIPAPALGAPQIAIMIYGGVAPSTVFSVVGSTPTPTEGVIIESTRSSGSGALLGGWGPSGAYGDFVFTKLRLENLTFRTVPDPTYSAVDLSHISDLEMRNVVCDAGSYSIGAMSQPTTSTSFALRLPGNNNDAFTRLDMVDVCGFYNGIEVGEHTCGDQVAAWGCVNAFKFPVADHASYFGRLMAVWCQNGLVPTGVHYTRISQYDIEHAASGWWSTGKDVLDSSNLLYGDLKWHAVLAGTGVSAVFTKTGGANLDTSRLGVAIPMGLGSTVTALSIVSGVVNVDCSLGDYFTLSLTTNVSSLTFSNLPAAGIGRTLSVTIKQDATGGRTFALPSAFKGIGGSDTAVQSAPNAVTKLSIETVDAGATWAYVMKARS